jgi:hypothetical protein
MPGVGAIHISEIEPTLRQLEKELGLTPVLASFQCEKHRKTNTFRSPQPLENKS